MLRAEIWEEISGWRHDAGIDMDTAILIADAWRSHQSIPASPLWNMKRRKNSATDKPWRGRRNLPRRAVINRSDTAPRILSSALVNVSEAVAIYSLKQYGMSLSAPRLSASRRRRAHQWKRHSRHYRVSWAAIKDNVILKYGCRRHDFKLFGVALIIDRHNYAVNRLWRRGSRQCRRHYIHFENKAALSIERPPAGWIYHEKASSHLLTGARKKCTEKHR